MVVPNVFVVGVLLVFVIMNYIHCFSKFSRGRGERGQFGGKGGGRGRSGVGRGGEFPAYDYDHNDPRGDYDVPSSTDLSVPTPPYNKDDYKTDGICDCENRMSPVCPSPTPVYITVQAECSSPQTTTTTGTTTLPRTPTTTLRTTTTTTTTTTKLPPTPTTATTTTLPPKLPTTTTALIRNGPSSRVTFQKNCQSLTKYVETVHGHAWISIIGAGFGGLALGVVLTAILFYCRNRTDTEKNSNTQNIEMPAKEDCTQPQCRSLEQDSYYYTLDAKDTVGGLHVYENDR